MRPRCRVGAVVAVSSPPGFDDVLIVCERGTVTNQSAASSVTAAALARRTASVHRSSFRPACGFESRKLQGERGGFDGFASHFILLTSALTQRCGVVQYQPTPSITSCHVTALRSFSFALHLKQRNATVGTEDELPSRSDAAWCEINQHPRSRPATSRRCEASASRSACHHAAALVP